MCFTAFSKIHVQRRLSLKLHDSSRESFNLNVGLEKRVIRSVLSPLYVLCFESAYKRFISGITSRKLFIDIWIICDEIKYVFGFIGMSLLCFSFRAVMGYRTSLFTLLVFLFLVYFLFFEFRCFESEWKLFIKFDKRVKIVSHYCNVLL